ncbi:hypothetical protein LWF15_04735 [Kineosporia rhizophila]|uniref:hypothetical protein n=1 Tax=Kineosporia TaxID=49184 RepID=UPI001E3FC61E|nr:MULTISPECIES: hypothetical protein [Kineosporia]MCE0534807.1 hypothetical protein [Kineosporia rhizophila]GLY19264.1 hypothetical protein Kisp01_62780 [Kineosporia sp. NBRC 101677]
MNATVRPRTPGLPEPQVQTFHAEPTVLLDRRSRPWLVLAAEQDPLRTRNGRLPIPRHCRERLKEIAESGVLFDAVVLAHELDPEQVDITAIPPSGRRCSPELAREVLGSVPAHPDLARVAGVFERITGAAPILAASLERLDPVVFGVIGPGRPPRDGEPALFFPLVAWRW